MTKISRTALKAQIDADIRVNGNREITPPKHNAIETNIIDSNLNLIDGGWVVEVEAGYLTEISLTDNRSFAHKKYVDDLISSIDVSWASLTGDPEDNTNLVSYLEDNYYKLDGSLPLTGNMDVDDNTLLNVLKITASGTNDLTIETGGDNHMLINYIGNFLFGDVDDFVATREFNFVKSSSAARMRLLTSMDADVGMEAYSNGDFVGGFIFDHASDVMSFYGKAGGGSSLNIEAGGDMNTNRDLKFSNNGKSIIISDDDAPSSFIRIRYSTALGIYAESL